MASAQGPSSSRKQGHLEAGKKRLEEFRKKKAEGRARKTAFSGPLQSADIERCERFSEGQEHVADEATSGIDSFSVSNSSGLVKAHEEQVFSSSHGANIGSSDWEHANSNAFANSNHALYDSLSQEAQKDELSKLYKSPGFSEPIQNDHLSQVNGELSPCGELQIRRTGFPATELLNVYNGVEMNQDVENKNHLFSSSSVTDAHSGENKLWSKSYVDDANKSGTHLANILSKQSASVFEQSRLGLPSISSNISAAFEESYARLEHHTPSNVIHDNATDGTKRSAISDSISRHLNVDHGAWQLSEPPSKGHGSSLQSFSEQHSSSYLGFGSNSDQLRPSFLDSLGITRVPSKSTMFSQPEKANPLLRVNSANLQRMGIEPLSSSQYFSTEPNNLDHSVELGREKAVGEQEYHMHASVSANNGQLNAEEFMDHHVHSHIEFATSKKDEGFAALEQHIEDLTREKFALQQALKTSQALAESLAAENSSLTDSYNQQGEVVNQLRSDMEQLQEEIKAQLRAHETVKRDYTNAQLECNSADEQTKILASEIIGLEEKALRFRSNELKLEKQLEDMNYEISSYKHKISIMQKERDDCQSTIDALQEEKKLLQYKLRKASDGKIPDAKKPPTFRRDASTSTEGLGVQVSHLVGEDAHTAEHSNMNALGSSTVLSSNASTSSLLPDYRGFHMPDASGGISHDQLRMIDNINSLISELVLEKEELMRALKTETSNNSKLKDLNKDLSQRLESQTQKLELLTAQRMASENSQAKPIEIQNVNESVEYADEGDEVVERVLGWIMKLFPGGPANRRSSKLL